MGTDEILIVDDEPGLASLYGALLQEQYDTRCVTSGDAALVAIEDGVEAIILDRNMPDIQGDEILTTLRDRGDETPISIVSAAKPNEEAFELPFDEYLIKPVEEDELREVAEILLDLRTVDETDRRRVILAVKLSLLYSLDSLRSTTEEEFVRVYSEEFEKMTANKSSAIAELPLRASVQSDVLDVLSAMKP